MINPNTANNIANEYECRIAQIHQGYMDREVKTRDALNHCKMVFISMAERGHYPEELLPGEHFMGKQGFQFITDALK